MSNTWLGFLVIEKEREKEIKWKESKETMLIELM